MVRRRGPRGLLRQLIFAIFGKSQNLVTAVISTREIYPVAV